MQMQHLHLRATRRQLADLISSAKNFTREASFLSAILKSSRTVFSIFALAAVSVAIVYRIYDYEGGAIFFLNQGWYVGTRSLL